MGANGIGTTAAAVSSKARERGGSQGDHWDANDLFAERKVVAMVQEKPDQLVGVPLLYCLHMYSSVNAHSTTPSGTEARSIHAPI